MLTLTVRRLYGSVQLGSISRPSMRNARAARAIAPRFSLSFRPSRTAIRLASSNHLPDAEWRPSLRTGDHATMQIETDHVGDQAALGDEDVDVPGGQCGEMCSESAHA
jgi:hypothetical protein